MTLRHSQTMEKLITVGEFAKLASTTKRTVQFYDQKGILKPAKVNAKGYRYYQEKQILDYQKILLLRTHGISLGEMTKFVKTRKQLSLLFNQKQKEIEGKIAGLQVSLQNVTHYMENLQQNGTMIKPKIVVMKPFEIYYEPRECAYASIGQHCSQLASKFDEEKSETFTALAVFENPTYQPKQSKILIGVLRKGAVLKKAFDGKVKMAIINPGKVIMYTHVGSGSMLSLFWKELEKYCRVHKITVRKDVPDFEIYRDMSKGSGQQVFEIYLPVE